MRDKYMKQLENLNNNMIEKSIENAISALVRQDVETAKKAIEYDAEIDEMEKNIENMCMKILLSQQPVASDLRTVSSALKMVTDMERIGDQASDIAELIPHLGEGDTYDACSHIPAMVVSEWSIRKTDRWCLRNLRRSVEIFRITGYSL